MAAEKVLFFESFDRVEDGKPLPPGWWAEGGERVRVESGRLYVKANPEKKAGRGNVCTVWYEKEFSGDIRVEFDACVVASTIDANNINFFLLYSDPSGKPLSESRRERSSAKYNLYHRLNGYIFTLVNDMKAVSGRNEDGSTKARFRMRRCPGFRLITESYGYHSKKGHTYHVVITKKGGELTCEVDGTVYLQGKDENPLTSGLIGLRTYQTELWWDNIKVTSLGEHKD